MGVRTLSHADRMALEELDARLKTILPEEYQDSYEGMEPVPMRSAGLKYDSDGKVAWNEIWGSFCDLAMAGGPPHKGVLLEAGRPADIGAEPDRYAGVAEEICRGVMMTTLLDTNVSPVPGWVRISCLSDAMTGWLLRAIVMENVAARAEGMALALPAAPHFRLEKEIKNVITVIAKTSHYWLEHMPRGQQRGIASLFARLAKESPLVEPSTTDGGEEAAGLSAAIRRDTGLQTSRRGLPQRAPRHLDDAGAGCRQRPVAPRGDDAVRPGESRHGSRGRQGGESGRTRASPGSGPQHSLNTQQALHHGAELAARIPIHFHECNRSCHDRGRTKGLRPRRAQGLLEQRPVGGLIGD